MKLAHYVKSGQTRVGIVNDGALHDLGSGARRAGLGRVSSSPSIDWILANGLLEKVVHAGPKIVKSTRGIPLSSVRLRSPILSPEKILLVAVNYGSHGKETNVAPPSSPHFFTKFNNALIGPDEPIILPKVSKKVDWEVELAVIIGKEGKYLEKSEALDHVAGYSVANDVSFRDYQLPQGWPDKLTPLGLNWVKGKGMDSSFPLGPWIVTKDEIPNPDDLHISLRVNGQLQQDSNTSEMIFKIDELLEYVSAGITLKPGDLISTGTPFGVAMATGHPYLKGGDLVEGTVERIGTLRNPAKTEV